MKEGHTSLDECNRLIDVRVKGPGHQIEACGALLTGLAICLASQAVEATTMAQNGLLIIRVMLCYAMQELQRCMLHQDRLQNRQGGAEGCPLSLCDDSSLI